jgi:hypothetical protein
MIGGAVECLGSDHIGVSRVEREDVKPGLLALGS